MRSSLALTGAMPNSSPPKHVKIRAMDGVFFSDSDKAAHEIYLKAVENGKAPKKPVVYEKKHQPTLTAEVDEENPGDGAHLSVS